MFYYIRYSTYNEIQQRDSKQDCGIRKLFCSFMTGGIKFFSICHDIVNNATDYKSAPADSGKL